jgi:hypothetical protein
VNVSEATYTNAIGDAMLGDYWQGAELSGLCAARPDGREPRPQPRANGKLPPVGDTVNLSIPSWTNTIGASELGAVWTDPDFNPQQKAFYYARVIEIPTSRWTAYDRVKFKLDLPQEIPLKTQERSYTSPIWYTPGS